MLFYGVRLGGRDDLDEIAAVVLELPPESGGRGARAPRPPTPPDIRVSYPAVPLGVVALDTSAPGLDFPPTPTTLAAPPLWAQIGFRLLRLPG